MDDEMALTILEKRCEFATKVLRELQAYVEDYLVADYPEVEVSEVTFMVHGHKAYTNIDIRGVQKDDQAKVKQDLTEKLKLILNRLSVTVRDY